MSAALMTHHAVARTRIHPPARPPTVPAKLRAEVPPPTGVGVQDPAEQPAASGGVLFTVTCRGTLFSVGHATEAEIACLGGGEEPTDVRDVLELWSLIAIRDPTGRRTAIYALGWRAHLQSTWITSPLVGIDLNRCQVATSLGQCYRLLEPDAPGLEPRLRGHLAVALLRRGFEDVRR
jgi:hypothetical protein